MSAELFSLLKKYDVATPRYTSYPTVPFWKLEKIDANTWKGAVIERFNQENGELCIYIHLPFCEELCTYCACNKRITKKHSVETPYIDSVLKEWNMYFDLFPQKPTIREIHLGGGTPTFFSPENLKKLIHGITNSCNISNEHEFSIEVHPNYTTLAHLQALKEVGFNRISLGVQDFDPIVQFVINRIQTLEQTKQVIDWARDLAYNSVNIDLIYGLPKQTLQSIEHTFGKVALLKPDRIAFYSYAHVPWKSKGQRRYSDKDVPKAEEKISMYDLGNTILQKMGFVNIGMDHFSLPNDSLLQAYERGKLHRNFMGYTTTNHKLVLGLGVSSISDTWNAFSQNEKEVEAYQKRIEQAELPLVNGHFLTEKDERIRRYILDLMCTDKVVLNEKDFSDEHWENIETQAKLLQDDGLLIFNENTITIQEKGKLFIRNICAVLDAYLFNSQIPQTLFSKAI